MAAFEKAGHWRQVFTVTAQLNTAPPETMAIARRIASQSNAAWHALGPYREVHAIKVIV
jgi:hypothetical protein